MRYILTALSMLILAGCAMDGGYATWGNRGSDEPKQYSPTQKQEGGSHAGSSRSSTKL
ncbi:hypothetical protein C7441_12133 [Pseudaminobacter salicylatoxidans]|uniref:Lipoprotein n=1 Tax=Pseudaminobacter salicylatoxidans TaxID=93369 RepID=A0A316BPV5_PSESE|nr:hypothetical protein C7441_12133 [Pseudaminobacter salicylatoxidans]